MKRAYTVFILLVLASCAGKQPKKTKAILKPGIDFEDTTSIKRLEIESKKPVYSLFVYDKKGQISDSLLHGSVWFDLVKTDCEQPFPSGLGCYQQPIQQTFLHICALKTNTYEEFYTGPADTVYPTKINKIVEQFKPTSGQSFFTATNCLPYYFFLTQVDSTSLFMADTQYGLLNFMRLKTKKYDLSYGIKRGEEEMVNMCKYMEIEWKKQVDVFMLDDNTVYKSFFRRWREFWECGQKYDYAPEYALVKLAPVDGLKRTYPNHTQRDYQNWLNNPNFIFSFIAMNKKTDTLFNNIRVKTYPLQLMTNKGIVRKGQGLDLNKDKHADVFWYNHITFEGPSMPVRHTILYLKINSDWTPVYIIKYNEYSGYETYEF